MPWDLSHSLSSLGASERAWPVPPARICGGALMEFPLRSFSHDVMTPIFLTHSKQCVGADAPDTQVAGSSWNWVGCALPANRCPRCTHRDKGESQTLRLVLFIIRSAELKVKTAEFFKLFSKVVYMCNKINYLFGRGDFPPSGKIAKLDFSDLWPAGAELVQLVRLHGGWFPC